MNPILYGQPEKSRTGVDEQEYGKNKGGHMECSKCGSGSMVDDSYSDIRVYKCLVCGNRLYVDHPKRLGSFVCCRCGENMETENELGYCKECLKHLKVIIAPVKERTYGETTCVCGATFIRKSPRQQFHAKDCRKRLAPFHVEPHLRGAVTALHGS